MIKIKFCCMVPVSKRKNCIKERKILLGFPQNNCWLLNDKLIELIQEGERSKTFNLQTVCHKSYKKTFRHALSPLFSRLRVKGVLAEVYPGSQQLFRTFPNFWTDRTVWLFSQFCLPTFCITNFKKLLDCTGTASEGNYFIMTQDWVRLLRSNGLRTLN